MKPKQLKNLPKNRIRHILSDVDGTITDGALRLNAEGYDHKVFEPHLTSAFDIFEELEVSVRFHTSGIRGFPITNKFMEMFSKHCDLLKTKTERINHIGKIAKEILDEDETTIVYLGDSQWDKAVFEACPMLYLVCPANADKEVREVANCVSPVFAGEGFLKWVANFVKECNKITGDRT